ncbi:hypothetical protein GCM10027289_16870 [Tsukamurella serpentis]
MSDLSWPAVRHLDATGGRGAIRGHLDLTDAHVRFRPAGLASRFEGTGFAVQLKHLVGAGLVDRPAGLLRRPRTHLCITIGDGSEHVFGVPRPDEVAAAIRERLGTR